MDALLNSKFGLKIALAIASNTPPRLGYTLSRFITSLIAARKGSALMQTLRQNQQRISSKTLSSNELDRAAKKTLQYSTRSVYDLYHNLNNLQSIDHLFVIEPSFKSMIHYPEPKGQGVIIAGLHMVGFDLVIHWLVPHVINPLILTIPNPEGGRALEFQRRTGMGIRLVPGSYKGVRDAIRFLGQGGIVVTGLDHPSPAFHPKLNFFGAPADLPTHHIFLALKARCPVVVAYSYLAEDGRYHVKASDPIEMDPYPNREDQLRLNGEKVIAVAEGFIQQHPHQWLVFQPVWGESG